MASKLSLNIVTSIVDMSGNLKAMETMDKVNKGHALASY